MFPLFETICVEQGELSHLAWHQQRLDRSYQQQYKQLCPFNLIKLIQIPTSWRSNQSSDKIKLRFQYNQCNYHISFSNYDQTPLKRLKLVNTVNINYQLKYSDRSIFNELIKAHPDADDLLILQNGFICDTTIANITFFDGNQWITPDTPLLQGTCRARLLQTGLIHEQSLTFSDLPRFKGFLLINAMRHFEPEKIVPMNCIIPF